MHRIQVQKGSVKLAVDSDSYWGNAMIGMYLGKRKVALYIHRLTCSSVQISCLTGGLLQNTTREYLPESVCLCIRVYVCVCVSVSLSVCLCVHDNSKSNQSRNIKLEYIVGYENISDQFDNRHG